jgi:hypothetical protein
MNILVIGNGFDLAHGLKTKYTDFLDWVSKRDTEYEICEDTDGRKKFFSAGLTEEQQRRIDDLKLNLDIPDHLKISVPDYLQKIPTGEFLNTEYQIQSWECINDNFWINYFLNCDMHGAENWIDFESEISRVISEISFSVYNRLDGNLLTSYNYSGIEWEINERFYKPNIKSELENLFNRLGVKSLNIANMGISYKELRDKLFSDLNRLTRAFEIYLLECLKTDDIRFKSPDIINLKYHKIHKILSFNFTDTYHKVYGGNSDFHFIHGKAYHNKNIEDITKPNGIILGIEEYLPEDRKNKETEFIAFKKFYQRIYKGTGNKYKEWVREIQDDYISYIKSQVPTSNVIERQTLQYKSKENIAKVEYKTPHYTVHRLYIFGHSLDVTDSDVLRELILNDNVCTTIYYRCEEQLGQQIANLVKVIGQDELIERTSRSDGENDFKCKIEFVKQEDMIPK